MLIRTFDPSTFHRFEDGGWQELFPWAGVVDTPFVSGWATVDPGFETEGHEHQEVEIYIVVQGEGVIAVADERREVGPGDIIVMPPFTRHALRNTSQTETLMFLSIFWESLADVEARLDALADAGPDLPERALVVAATATPNGELHVGHLAGPFLAADAQTRYLRMHGVPVVFASGTDDNHTILERAARAEGTEAATLAARVSEAIEASLGLAWVCPDRFVRPRHDAAFVAEVQRFVADLHTRGHLVAREASALLCERCDRQVESCNVTGGCPRCGAEADGYLCEACGQPTEACSLVSPRCGLCDGALAPTDLPRLFLPLEPFRASIRVFLSTARMSPRVRALWESMLD